MSVQGIAKNLYQQIDKIYRSDNEGSFETRARYREACYRFCDFLASEFRLVKFQNVREKHVVAYVKHMVAEGISPQTMKTGLSGIRNFYEKGGGKFKLPSNNHLDLPARKTKEEQEDRAWTPNEIRSAQVIAANMGRGDVVLGIDIARNFGTRIDELSSLRVSHLQDALKMRELTLDNTKGGLVRGVPIETAEQRSVLIRGIEYAKEHGRVRGGDYVFAEGRKHGVLVQKNSFTDWMSNHRGKFQEDFRTKHTAEYDRMKAAAEAAGVKLNAEHATWHGLRYAYAQSRYDKLYEQYKAAGQSDKQADYSACRKVSEELGHHRPQITRIYLAKR